MSSQSKVDAFPVFMATLAELTEAVEEYLNWAATPGEDFCPDETVERLCRAHEEARSLIDGLGHGQTFS